MAAIGLILLALGAGLGFASVSPWSNSNPSVTTFGVAAAIWLIVVQWLSAAFGGYLTGRLRTKWVSVPEIYNKDLLVRRGALERWLIFRTRLRKRLYGSGVRSAITSALHWPLQNSTSGSWCCAMKRSKAATNRRLIGLISADEASGCPRCTRKKLAAPSGLCSQGRNSSFGYL